MIEDIPCKSCGRYYGHRSNCISFTLNTGVSDKLMFMEFERRYQGAFNESESEIQKLQQENAELQNKLSNSNKNGLEMYRDFGKLQQENTILKQVASVIVDQNIHEQGCIGESENRRFQCDCINKEISELMKQITKGE